MAELYGIMSLLDPDEFGEEGEFLERYGGSRDQPMPSAEQVLALQARAPAHRRAQRPLQSCRNTQRLLHSTPPTRLQCCCPQPATHKIYMWRLCKKRQVTLTHLLPMLRRPTTMRLLSSLYQRHCTTAHASCVHRADRHPAIAATVRAARRRRRCARASCGA